MATKQHYKMETLCRKNSTLENHGFRFMPNQDESDCNELLNNDSKLVTFLKETPDWIDLRFPCEVVIGHPNEDQRQIQVNMDLLQAAIASNFGQDVQAILKIAHNQNVLTRLLKNPLEIPQGISSLEQDWQWLQNCQAVHLAAKFSLESLLLLLESCPGLKENAENDNRWTPLHIASTKDDDSLTLQYLLSKPVQVNAINKHGETSLHLAAHHGLVSNVVSLVFEGKSNLTILDYAGFSAIHRASSSQIINILLSKMKSGDIAKVNKEDNPLFDHILAHHPNALETFLDSLVTAEKPDLEAKNQHLIYDLSLFNQGTTEKVNHLDKHLDLIEAGKSNLLLHPIMWIFLEVKWYQHRAKYLLNFFIFLLFLIVLTLQGTHYINLIECTPKNTTCTEGISNLCFNMETMENSNCSSLICHKNTSWRFNTSEDDPSRFDLSEILKCFRDHFNQSHQKSQQEKAIQASTDLDIYSCLVTILLIILSCWEFCQFASKLIGKKLLKYFNVQNVIEVIVITTTTTFLLCQWTDIEAADHLLGWALFFAWLDLTLFLGRFNKFGRNIYMSLYVVKKVAWSFIVFIPSLIAFGTAFHCFLYGSEAFRGLVSSCLKVIAMMLGEFDFDEHFLYPQVRKVGGRNFSTQLAFVIFIIYGSVIVMNLLIALMVNKTDVKKAEVILLENRIEEISGLTEIKDLFTRPEQGKKTTPSQVFVKVNCEEKIETGLFEQMKIWTQAQVGNPKTDLFIKDEDDQEKGGLKRYQKYRVKEKLIKATLKVLQRKKKAQFEQTSNFKSNQAEIKQKLEKTRKKSGDVEIKDVMSKLAKIEEKLDSLFVK